MSSNHHLLQLALLLCLGCGGETLPIGYDDAALDNDPAAPVDLAAAFERCGAPAGADELVGSPDAQFAAAAGLLVGRWFACPTNPASTTVPSAIELTAKTESPLHDAGGAVYVRGPEMAISLRYGFREASLEIVLGDTSYLLAFQANPRRMIWGSGGAQFMFVKN